MDDPNIQRHYVRVTNNLDLAFTDMCDGVPVRLEPGKSDNFPLEMAAHFFGYYLDAPKDVMFRHVCKRQGWNTSVHMAVQSSGKTLAQELFDKIEIKPVIYRMVEQAPDLDAPIAADAGLPAIERDAEIPALPPRRKAGAS